MKMTPEKRKKLLSIVVFMYSFGMAFALLIEGRYSLTVSVVALGYFGLIVAWLWLMIGDE